MAFDRAELEEMKERWLEANIVAEQAGDWKPLADFYTEDATYGWNYGPDKDFMAVGRDEIREIALGQEMEGLEGWTYPYQEWVIDDRTGSMIGLWKQVYERKRDDGTPYALEGIQGSWFKYGGNFQFCCRKTLWTILENPFSCRILCCVFFDFICCINCKLLCAVCIYIQHFLTESRRV